MRQPFYGYVIFNIGFHNEPDISFLSEKIVDDICHVVEEALVNLLGNEAVIAVENNGVNYEDMSFEILPSLVNHTVEEPEILLLIQEKTRSVIATRLKKMGGFDLTVAVAESEAGDPHDVGYEWMDPTNGDLDAEGLFDGMTQDEIAEFYASENDEIIAGYEWSESQEDE